MSRNTTLPVLTTIYQADGPVTAKEIGLSPVTAGRMVNDGLLKVKGTVRTGKRGRPARKLALTDKARKRARRALA